MIVNKQGNRNRGERGRKPRYGELEVRNWLKNIASGMQSAGHSVLLIEQLQPGMLPRRREKIAYIFITRCLAGLAVGLTAGALHHGLYVGSAAMKPGVAGVWGLGAGLATAFAAIAKLARRILDRFPISPGVGIEVFRVVLGSLVASVGVTAAEYAYRLMFFRGIGFVELTVDQFVLIGFIAVLTGLLGARTMGRAFSGDIECIETLGFSWKQSIPGFVAGGVVSFLLALVYVYFISTGLVGVDPSAVEPVSQTTPIGAELASSTVRPDQRTGAERTFQCLVITIVGLVVGGTFHGLVPTTRDKKTFPNQGILLTARYCLWTGLGLGFFSGGLWGLCVYAIYDHLPAIKPTGIQLVGLIEKGISLLPMSEAAQAGLMVGVFGGGGVFVVAGIWFGGLDVMRHYVLRILLAVHGYIPLRLIPFLNYSADELKFFDHVGGGYRFIHRYLQEYFASLSIAADDSEVSADGPDDQASNDRAEALRRRILSS